MNTFLIGFFKLKWDSLMYIRSNLRNFLVIDRLIQTTSLPSWVSSDSCQTFFYFNVSQLNQPGRKLDTIPQFNQTFDGKTWTVWMDLENPVEKNSTLTTFFEKYEKQTDVYITFTQDIQLPFIPDSDLKNVDQKN